MPKSGEYVIAKERMKALWLIDAGYLFKAKPYNEPYYQFSYKKLKDKIEQDGRIWRAYYLNSIPSPITEQQERFHSWLRTAPPDGPGIITKLYELKRMRLDRAYCLNCRSVIEPRCSHCPENNSGQLFIEQQKGVDVGLATLALTLDSHYETLVLSAGDGDLLDAIEFLSQQGKRIELVVFKYGVSTELQARADNIYWIDDFKDEVRS
jgi:uncharacterized LabA/DUF88 family protein